MNHSINTRKSFGNAIGAMVLALLLLVFAGGCASHRTGAPDKDYDKAVAAMNDGYAALGKVVSDLDHDNMRSAKRHLNKALKDFDKSFVYFAKAVLPPEDRAAVDKLKKGFSALEKCVKELEKSNINFDKAQQLYDDAQAHFATAADLM